MDFLFEVAICSIVSLGLYWTFVQLFHWATEYKFVQKSEKTVGWYEKKGSMFNSGLSKEREKCYQELHKHLNQLELE